MLASCPKFFGRAARGVVGTATKFWVHSIFKLHCGCCALAGVLSHCARPLWGRARRIRALVGASGCPQA